MGIDPIHEAGIWSIGLLSGRSLDTLAESKITNPIISAKDFSKWDGKAVADPFAIFRHGVWYVFFELFQHRTQNAVIGASSSRDLVNWVPLGVVLTQPHHLSYPFVFEHNGEVYMMPESKSANRVDLFRAVEFPHRWEFDRTILKGRLMDCSMVHHSGRYWIFAGWRSYSLKLFCIRLRWGLGSLTGCLCCEAIRNRLRDPAADQFPTITSSFAFPRIAKNVMVTSCELGISPK